MSLLLAAGLSAGIGAAGNLANSAMNYGFNKSLQEDSQRFNAEEAQRARDFTAQENLLNRDFNSAEAQRAREFQEYMASTNYQRTMSDMEAAGINPAAIGGVGGTGTGSAGSSAGYSSAGGAAAASSGINRVGIGELFNNALISSFRDKDVLEAFSNNLKSNAKDVKSSEDLKPTDLMSPQQRAAYDSYLDKTISSHKGGFEAKYTKAEKAANAYYESLSKALNKL